jgi:glycine cleavage system H protein
MEGFLETTYDKFIFRVKEGYLYLKEDFWANIDGNSASVGISDFLQKSRGDVAFLETVEAGSEVRQGEGIGTIETIKATFAIIAPVTGRVMEINPKLEGSPYLLNEDPYGEGWIYKIELTRLEEDQKGLLSATDYLELMKAKIVEEMKKK